LLLLAAALPTAGRLTFDQTIESFFAPQHPDIQLLKRTREVFGGDEFVIVAWRQAGLLTSEDGEEPVEVAAGAGEVIRGLADRLSALPGVDGERTRDLQQLLSQSPRNRNTRRAMLKLFEGLLVSADRQTTAIVLQLEPAVRSAVPRQRAIEEIRRTAEGLRPGCAVAGEPVQIQEMFDLVERDGNVLYAASLLVLSGMLLWIFRGLRWVAASLLVVLGAVATTRAVLVLAGTQLSMVSSMLNSLVTVIAISTTTHITVHYRELRVQGGLTAEQSLRRTFSELATPVFWTVVTVAAGFAALLVSEIVPVRSFAIMMTLGTLMVPLLILLVLPAAFASGRMVPMPGRVGLEDRLDRWLERMAEAIDRHPLATSAVCVLLTLITLPGLLVLQVETDFSRNFRDSSPMIQALRFVESELGPAGTWDVSFNVPEPLTTGFLDRVDELSGRLRDLQEQGLQVGRLIAARALGNSVPGITINRYCASGLEAIALAAAKIKAGMGHCFIAGGTESMSLVPMTGYKLVPSYTAALENIHLHVSMGHTAEAVAQKYHISREEADAFSVRSHQLAHKAIETGKFKDEIAPVKVTQISVENNLRVQKEWTVDTDEGVRPDTSIEGLSRLKAAFKINGVVTAGNASQTSDGAAFVLVVSEEMLRKLNVAPSARWVSYAVGGVDPLFMGIGPIVAIPKALKQGGLGLADIDVIELNEAFAVQALAVIKEAGLNPDIVNVNGGAIALGHPLGCTGAKLTIQTMHELKRQKKKYGMITACVGGGQGIAGIIENLT